MHYNKLTNEEKIVVNSEVSKNGKNIVVAFLLTLFVGTLGIHRLYLNKNGTGIALASMTIVGWLTSWLIVGLIPLAITGTWAFIDLFFVPKMVREDNEKLEEKYAEKLILERK